MMIRATVLLAALLFAGGASDPANSWAQTATAQSQLPLPRAQPGMLRSGRGAIASSRIGTVGRPIGHMYRTAPMNEFDSGWIFLAGDEAPGALNDVEQLGIYDLDVLVRHDPAIAAHLNAPVGSDFTRVGDRFVPSGHPRHE